ncbi:urea ABC transporter ATP-binding subunit UrtE [Acuticoccus sp. M5D2P5]|uniref:urea ABC transporter ATP-binding subunit UrtE n=1 Tax=Acuticoccus kalidii TaxID=2910977 RepID=UPI001F2343B0|nr:urea ABC transporter ATP-binding subunit UrtE [Acuticoccus kalidii]MCF3934726.1 urea ABC transporter ATP-binding subunit UrtE [Acuticoccus kalidii]
MLTMKDVCLHYGQSQILYDVSIDAAVGNVTCVMGTNGVGKTSLLKTIAGTHHRSHGLYSLDGEEIGKPAPHILAHKGVAVVPQGRDIFPLLTVKENLETGYACLPRGARKVPGEIFELFPVLKQMLGRRGGDLSGGQQQQLSIARALITKPKLLLMDEPTEGIQPNIIKQIGEVIKYLRDQRTMAIVLVEQYFQFAYDLADEFVVLERGAVTLTGDKSAITEERLLEAVSV